MDIFGMNFWALCALLYCSWISFIVFLAVFGLSFGARKLFVHVMLYIFEACREKIVKTEKDVFRLEGEHDKLKAEEPMIQREVIITSSHGVQLEDGTLGEDHIHRFHMMDISYFYKSGIEAIVEDGVTSTFQAEEIPSWNLLTRTTVLPEFISWRMNLIWVLGFIVRYFILFPFRFSLFLVALSLNIGGNCFIGAAVPWASVRRFFYRYINLAASRILMRSFSAVATFHNRQYRAKGGGICVANHTSPIDTYLLGTDNVYALVGQSQGGLFGWIQWAYGRAESHIWFNRAEAGDRMAVARRLREHVSDVNKLPILIFPEGTCINNTSIMMFKKGSFETGGTIYPAAIKYDPRFSDAFWNSSRYSLFTYLLMLMTSWALVADVRYLPPQTLKPGENAITFANRVKADIAREGGLVDLDWDGQMKRYKPKDSIKQSAQRVYSASLLKQD